MCVTYPDLRYLSGCSLPIRMCIGPGNNHHHRRARQPGPINVARNSLATTSNFEVTLLELQRFQRLLKLHPNELRAKFWKTVPQATNAAAKHRGRKQRLNTEAGPISPQDLTPLSHPISHVIPSRVLQTLKSHCWNCNVSSDC